VNRGKEKKEKIHGVGGGSEHWKQNRQAVSLDERDEKQNKNQTNRTEQNTKQIGRHQQQHAEKGTRPAMRCI